MPNPPNPWSSTPSLQYSKLQLYLAAMAATAALLFDVPCTKIISIFQ